MWFKYMTKKSKGFAQIMDDMDNYANGSLSASEEFWYKFNNNWDYYDGYIIANYDRTTDMSAYRINLNRAFKHVNNFNQLTEVKQNEMLADPYSHGNQNIRFWQGYVDFYNDTHKNK